MKTATFPFFANLDIIKSEEDEAGRWVIEGFASTTDADLQDEVVSQDAIDSSAKDLEGNSTVLLNHDQKEPIGRVLESEARKGGLWIKVLISKTVPEIWTKIKEGVLNKFSIRGKVKDAEKRWVEAAKKFIKVIKKMFLVEVSLVSVPANPNAKALRWYIEKAFEDWEATNGELEVQGGQDMKTGKGERQESQGVPDIVKDEEGKKAEAGKQEAGKDEVKKTEDMKAEDIVKAATAHAALLAERVAAIQKVAGLIAEGASTMSPQELRTLVNQLSDLGWKVNDVADVVNISKSEAGTEKAGPRTEEERAMAHFKLSKEKWDALSEDEKKKLIAELPSRGTAEKGFPAPEQLQKEWVDFCEKNSLVKELDEKKVFAKWLDFCKENGYPSPYPYPYPKEPEGEGDGKMSEVMGLIEKLIEGATSEPEKKLLTELKALVAGMMHKYPVPKQEDAAKAKKKPMSEEEMNAEEEEKKKGKAGTCKSGDAGSDDIEKKGAKMAGTRLKNLLEVIEKLQALAKELSPEATKSLDELKKTLTDEAKAEQSLEEVKKTLAVEVKKSFDDIMKPLEERLSRIEKIEGIQKSEKGQEKTPDEKGKKSPDGAGKGADDGKKNPGVWKGILGDSLQRARSSYGG